MQEKTTHCRDTQVRRLPWSRNLRLCKASRELVSSQPLIQKWQAEDPPSQSACWIVLFNSSVFFQKFFVYHKHIKTQPMPPHVLSPALCSGQESRSSEGASNWLSLRRAPVPELPGAEVGTSYWASIMDCGILLPGATLYDLVLHEGRLQGLSRGCWNPAYLCSLTHVSGLDKL
jgi:hypothetical protein